jgi:hypothetical protein
VNPLLFVVLLGLVIALAVFACVRALLDHGRTRAFWLGVIALIVGTTLWSLVFG